MSRIYYDIRYYQLPTMTPRLARIPLPYQEGSREEDAAVREFRGRAAKLGANAIVAETSEGKMHLVAVFLDARGREAVSRLVVAGTGGTSPESSPSGASSSSYAPATSSGGPVQVRGYTRKDGTYVRPHTRSRPTK